MSLVETAPPDPRSLFTLKWSQYKARRFRDTAERASALGEIYGVLDSLYHMLPIDVFASWQVEAIRELRGEIEELLAIGLKGGADRSLLQRLEDKISLYARQMFRLYTTVTGR